MATHTAGTDADADIRGIKYNDSESEKYVKINGRDMKNIALAYASNVRKALTAGHSLDACSSENTVGIVAAPCPAPAVPHQRLCFGSGHDSLSSVRCGRVKSGYMYSDQEGRHPPPGFALEGCLTVSSNDDDDDL